MQPKCKYDDEKYCIREVCVGPCTLVETIYVSEEEMALLVNYVTPKKEKLN